MFRLYYHQSETMSLSFRINNYTARVGEWTEFCEEARMEIMRRLFGGQSFNVRLFKFLNWYCPGGGEAWTIVRMLEQVVLKERGATHRVATDHTS